MRHFLAVLIGLSIAGSAKAQGLMIPQDASLSPLVLVAQEVSVTVEDQAAQTRVVQTFRNPTGRAIEATYIFPVPKGAGVKQLVMWVGGKEVKADLLEADKARAVYTDVVRRMHDPALLEYFGQDLLKLKVFPVPANGEQKVAVTFTSLLPSESGLIEYLYPLRAHGPSAGKLRQFTLTATLKAQRPIQNIYSPTHAITVGRPSEREAVIHCEAQLFNRDFQLYYTSGAKDVGLTALTQRTNRGEKGYFLMLISPRAELAKIQQAPRDMVFVLDTSGSMEGKRIIQARNALKFCLRNLGDRDRFGLIHFATSVTPYKNELLAATPKEIEQAQDWVEYLEAGGSTNIDAALAAALAMRSPDSERSFTIVFFTDGLPTIGETRPEQIIKNVAQRNTANTRIFTFGVGDDVNAVLLDQLAERTRSAATYVREKENIEAKVSALYSKISRPVLTDLKLSVGKDVTISEIYPPQLPDLFDGSQLVVLGRYHGQGHAAVKLTGMVGKARKEFDYEMKFPAQTGQEKAFVEDLWARRKVGYLLDQIRVHGENKETKEEVQQLARKYRIATPYTSFLVVPDARLTTLPPGGMMGGGMGMMGGGMFPGGMPGMGMMGGMPAMMMGGGMMMGMSGTGAVGGMTVKNATVQSGKKGVDLSLLLSDLRNQDRTAPASVRQAAGRQMLNLYGVWTDEGAKPNMPVVKIKAQSEAYFRILQRHPSVSEVFQLGNRVVWVTPSESVLVIDESVGVETMSDEAIDRLMRVKK